MLTFTEYLKSKGFLQDYEAIKSNLTEYEADIEALDFEKQPQLLEQYRLEIAACRKALEEYYKKYRKDIAE